MKNKEKYYKELIENNGYLDEIELGEKIYIDEDETRKIISQLLSENKIEYAENRFCNYRITRATKRKKYK